METRFRIIVFAIGLIGLALGVESCSVSRFVPEGKALYNGASVSVNGPDSIGKTGKIQQKLQALLYPEPNTSFLGGRLPLYFHYKAQKEKPGVIMKWLDEKFGEPPVYLGDVNQNRQKELLLNKLDNSGFFYSNVLKELDSSDNGISIAYEATVRAPYRMATYGLENDSLPVHDAIQRSLSETVLEKGTVFDIGNLKAERERIDVYLKQRGYYYFNPDFLIFEADTNRYKNKQFDLFLRFKRESPPKAFVPQVINKITVYPEYQVTKDTATLKHTTYGGMEFVQDDNFFRPKRLAPYILFEKGQRYDAERSKRTSNRLADIGSYKYANIQFETAQTTGLQDSLGLLDVSIFLSPLTRRSLRVALQATTKSNGFTGPGITATFSNRNLFHGGETFNITGSFAYESQLTGSTGNGLTSIVGGLQTELVIPRLVPFSPSRFKYAVPKTRVTLGGDFLNRTQLYTLTSLTTNYGYTWNANRFVYHELNPISINYVNLANTTEEFDAILEENAFLRASFEQQFIAGLNYSFTYNELADDQKKKAFFLGANLDIAGNLLQALSGGRERVLGLEYAQYVKLDADLRYYWKLGGNQTLIGRLYSGWGIPVGNSNTLPFTKQFFSGGPYSVRAFPIRALGPGTFRSTDEGNGSFFDQSGNLQLEANVEYRFPIWSYLKGALFADAGNVWLTYTPEIDADESQESRDFNQRLSENGRFGSDWAGELGVGVGLGLRVDIQSFVIRLDLASPWRVPYLPKKERSRVPFFDGGDDNLILNFAIGYPF